MVLTVLVAPSQELQVVDMVVVIARGAKNFEGQVPYDRRGSAGRRGLCEGAVALTGWRGHSVCMLRPSHLGRVSHHPGAGKQRYDHSQGQGAYTGKELTHFSIWVPHSLG